MNKTIIERLGMGQGHGTKVEVLAREEIVKIIKDLDMREIAKKSWIGFNKGFKTGYAAINLETGELYGECLGRGESNQAIDNTFITIYDFDQNFDIGDMELIDEDGNRLEGDEEVEAMFEEIDFSGSLDWDDINRQLDEFYK